MLQNYIEANKIEGLKGNMSEVEGMLKALIGLLENKHLNP
jgi:hypothetical protein